MRRQSNALLRSTAPAVLALLLTAAACQRDAPSAAGSRLAFDAVIRREFPRETHLTLGDPQVRLQLALTGELDKLPFTATWANISGGPHTIEAFRAGALELASQVANETSAQLHLHQGATP